MKKTAIVAIVLACVLALGGGSAFAVGQIAKGNAISEDTACNFAYVDAGVNPEDAQVTRVEFEYEGGRFMYEVEFSANGTEYDYKIDSSTGQVISKETEVIQSASQVTPGQDTESQGGATTAPEQTTPSQTQPTQSQPSQPQAPNPQPSQTQPSQPQNTGTSSADATITVDQAKQIALNHAGVSAGSVTFEKAKLDRDDGRAVYDIEFYIKGQTEYDYEIDATTGAIIEAESEPWDD